MSSHVKVIGEQLLLAALKKFNLDVKISVDNAVRTTAFKVLDNAVRAIQTESIGRATTSSESNVVHIASKKGDAPNTDTGRLVSSLQVDHQRGSMVAFVGSNLDYARFLEEDLDRPFLHPAKEKEADKFTQRIADAINIQILESGK